MSLATRCPACGTVFRVVQDQLRVSQGWVRCGRCSEAFNALESMVELRPAPVVAAPVAAGPVQAAPDLASSPTPASTVASTVASAPAGPVDAPPGAGPTAAHQSLTTDLAPAADTAAPPDPFDEGAPPPAPPPAEPPVAGDPGLPTEPPAGPDLPEDVAGASFDPRQEPAFGFDEPPAAVVGDATWPTTAAPDTVSPAGPPEQADRLAHDAAGTAPGPMQVDIAEGGPTAGLADEPAPSLLSAPAAPGPDPDTLPATVDLDVDLNEPPAREGAGSAARADPVDLAVPETADADRTDERGHGGDTDAGSADTSQAPRSPAATAGAADTPDDAPLSTLQAPSFIRQADQAERWRRPGVRRALVAAAGLAAAVLAAQVVYTFRDRLAAGSPALRPVLQQACATLGCRVGEYRQIEALSVESSGLVKVEGAPVYRLSVTLRNRASIDVAAPALDLALTDAQGKPIARRVLQMSDLNLPLRSLKAGSELPIQVPLGISDRQVSGYTVEIFYP